MDEANQIVWVNDEFQSAQNAKISIFDRGLLFGDAVYEVFLVHQSQIFNFDSHYERLLRSLKLLAIENPMSEEKIKRITQVLVEKNELQNEDCALYLQISRGSQYPRNAIYSEFLTAKEANSFITLHPVKLNRKLKSIKAKLMPDIRWGWATIKTNNLLANSFLLSQVHQKNKFDEVIFYRDGFLTEASSSNLFIFKNNQIHTPKLSDQILPGTTRKQIVVNVASQLGYAICERDIAVSELTNPDERQQIDEIWVSSSTKLVWSINQIDDHIIQSGSSVVAERILKKLIEEIDNPQSTYY